MSVDTRPRPHASQADKPQALQDDDAPELRPEELGAFLLLLRRHRAEAQRFTNMLDIEGSGLEAEVLGRYGELIEDFERALAQATTLAAID